MRLLLALAATFAIASASTLRFEAPAQSTEWELFKATHKKTYPTKLHENLR